MSKIDRDVIRHLERLARIDLAPGEVDTITEQLTRIVAMVEQLQQVDVGDVPPTRAMAFEDAGVTDTREDVVTPGLDRTTVLSQAPDATDAFFKVPRVINRGEES